MKKALVLGVGNAQVDLIQYLKRENWWVIGCSYRHEGNGLKDVDQFERVNITDLDGIEQLVRANNVDLIYSIGSDMAMPTIASVTSRMGLPGFIDYETASLLQDKVQLRDFLTVHQLSPIGYRMIRNVDDLNGWDQYPAMVKPTDNQGQRGVFLASSAKDVEAQLESTLGFSRSHKAIVEEYLAGPEVSVNAFVVDGAVVFCEVSDRLVVEGIAGGIPRSHVLPSQNCTGAMLVETKELAVRCIETIGILNGPVYFQIILTANGPRVVEVAPRLDGCHMWRLIRTVYGADLLDASIRLLTGDKSFDLGVTREPFASHLNFFLAPPNTVFSRPNHVAPQDTLHLEYYYADGETVRPVNGLLEKVGYYIEREPEA